MNSGKCVYLRTMVLRSVFNHEAFSLPNGFYVALSLSAFDPGTDGASLVTSEVTTGSGYDRQFVTNGAWSGYDTGTIANVNPVEWPTVTGSGYGTVLSFYLVQGNAKSGADHVFYGSDVPSLLVGPGPGPKFLPGTLIVVES